LTPTASKKARFVKFGVKKSNLATLDVEVATLTTGQRPEVYGYGNFSIGLDPKFFHKLHVQSVSEDLK